MPRTRESILTPTNYEIDGNTIRAYYDESHNLVFVLDETINADKPNVLLVIDSFDGRKWDDVLANDYNVDLETVRPKRDNKYQKLDIEYGGLDVYSELISAYESGEDLSGMLNNLVRFRAMSVRRAARERLNAAEETINKSHETIERTSGAISELRTKIKELRARVAEQRRGIGREPTKASAAKILKTEAQIETTNDKLARAKKRLTSAQRRLTAAEEDAEIARAILACDVPHITEPKVSAPMRSKPQNDVVTSSKSVDNDEYEENEEVISPEPKADEMDDNEVKPLFDKDPENLDDDKAFKPIEFDSGENEVTVPYDNNVVDDAIAPAPLAFTPPLSQNEPVASSEQPVDEPSVPMLDGLTSLSENEPVAAVQEPVAEPEPITPVEPVTPLAPAIEPEPITPVEPVTPIVSAAAVRPVSPITGNATPVTEQKPQKPTLMYYLLLVLLILLSIGTLWIYQKSTNENIPDLSKTIVAEQSAKDQPKVAEPTVKAVETNAFVIVPDIVKKDVVEEPEIVAEPEPVAAAIVEPEPVSAEPEPVAIVEEVETEPIEAEPEPVVVETDAVVVEKEPEQPVETSPFIDVEPVVMPSTKYEPEPVKIPSEEEVMARKPDYNVSQNEKMFVADDVYENELVLQLPEEETESLVCEGGAAPDSLGCCNGEEYTYTDDGFMCCNADECFPPMGSK